MATAGDGRAPYESGGAGGKFRKRPFRRSAPATPYDRPPTAPRSNNPGLLTKLVDPASRLIYAGAHKLFGVFRKRLPPLSLQGPPEINEKPKNVSQEAGRNNSIGVPKLSIDQGGNSASVSDATRISELEQMLKHKTFTRSEIQHLTALLHSRTTESPSDNAVKRIEASTSGSLKIHEDNRDNFHAAISTPITSSRGFEKETYTPADLAKAHMGTRPTKMARSPLGLTSQDSNLINNTTSLIKTPITSISPKNGFLTPRSRGRSAMYSMARAPYSRSPLNSNQKEVMSSSQSLKRRSSVLEDDFGSGGPLRRTRQKANLLLESRDKRELGYTTFQQPMLLKNKPEEIGSTITHVSVPTKSTQTATKIFQQLEKLSPKKSPTKLTSNMLHGQALRSLEKVDSPKVLPTSHDTHKSEVQHRDSGDSTSRGKEKVEENGPRKFPVPFNMLTTVNGDMGVSSKESAQIVTIKDSTLKLSPEPPQKKRAFQMSAPEDSWELDDDDDDDDIHVNGHVSFPPVENNKPETSSATNKPVSSGIIEPPILPEVSKTPAPVEATPVVDVVVPEVAKIPEPVELKEPEKAKPLPKTDGFLGGNVTEQQTGFKFPTSPLSTFTTQTSVLPQSTPQKDEVTLHEKVSPFQFSESKSRTSSDPKAPESTSLFSSDTKKDQFKVANKDENGNDQKVENIPATTSTGAMFSFASSAKNSSSRAMTPDSSPSLFSSSTPFLTSDGNTSSSITPASTSISASSVLATSLPAPVFSFGSAKPTTSMTETVNTNVINEKEPKSTINSSLFATTTTTPSGGGLFGFNSPATTSTTTTGGALFGFSSPAATSTTTATGGALFGFSSPAATSTTATTGGALFGFSSPAATSTTATTTTGSALFGFSSPAPSPTTATTTTGSALFGFSSPAATSTAAATTTGGALFGFSSPAGTSIATPQSQGSFSQANTVPFQFGSGSSSSSSVFGSSAPSFGINTAAAASEGKSVNSTSGPTSSIFGSSWQPPNSSVFSFGASSAPTPSPITFGASTGSSMFSFTTSGPTTPSFGSPSQVFGSPSPAFANNNDQMSMEDSMAEDSMQTPSPTPTVSPFGQAAPAAAPGFMFGSATQAPPQPAAPFQFGGQPNQAAPQNPFQSSSVEFNGGGGSFSLGSGGDKSGRRIVRVNKNKNRRK